MVKSDVMRGRRSKSIGFGLFVVVAGLVAAGSFFVEVLGPVAAALAVGVPLAALAVGVALATALAVGVALANGVAFFSAFLTGVGFASFFDFTADACSVLAFFLGGLFEVIVCHTDPTPNCSKSHVLDFPETPPVKPRCRNSSCNCATVMLSLTRRVAASWALPRRLTLGLGF